MFFLFIINNKGGKEGRIGLGGDSGDGGMPGFGIEKGLEGVKGSTGKDGKIGKSGTDGQIEYVLMNQENQIEEQGNHIFNVKLIDFEVKALTDDGIFEPNESFKIENIKIQNSGDLSLPEGCLLSFHSKSLVEFETKEMKLPKLKGKEEIILKQVFYGKIIEKQQNIGEKYYDEITISSSITLLDIEFQDSILSKKFIIQYPIIVIIFKVLIFRYNQFNLLKR